MSEVIHFLFVIDVSGSMFGQKIASVNGVLAECLAELKRVYNSETKVSLVTFSDTMKEIIINQSLENTNIIRVEVKPNADGFFPVTSFSSLVKSIKSLFENETISDGKQGSKTFIFLFSDVKPIEKKRYNEELTKIQKNLEFKNATKYVGYAEEGSVKYTEDAVRFVDYKADHIVPISEMLTVIKKLETILYLESNQSEQENVFY